MFVSEVSEDDDDTGFESIIKQLDGHDSAYQSWDPSSDERNVYYSLEQFLGAPIPSMPFEVTIDDCVGAICSRQKEWLTVRDQLQRQ